MGDQLMFLYATQSTSLWALYRTETKTWLRHTTNLVTGGDSFPPHLSSTSFILNTGWYFQAEMQNPRPWRKAPNLYDCPSKTKYWKFQPKSDKYVRTFVWNSTNVVQCSKTQAQGCQPEVETCHIPFLVASDQSVTTFIIYTWGYLGIGSHAGSKIAWKREERRPTQIFHCVEVMCEGGGPTHGQELVWFNLPQATNGGASRLSSDCPEGAEGRT